MSFVKLSKLKGTAIKNVEVIPASKDVGIGRLSGLLNFQSAHLAVFLLHTFYINGLLSKSSFQQEYSVLQI